MIAHSSIDICAGFAQHLWRNPLRLRRVVDLAVALYSLRLA